MSEFLETFGRAYLASGVKNIDGRGYWYDKFLKFIPGHNFEGSTLIAKTVTLDHRDGNLPLKSNLQPKDFFPKCVKIYPFSGSIMNAVGVSNPGLCSVLKMGIWQKITKPFLISIIPVRKTHEERLREMHTIVRILSHHIDEFEVPVGIQFNVSCPNVGRKEYIKEISEYLDILNIIDLQIDLKVSVLFPVEQINSLSCKYDIITCSNTIPYGRFSDEIDWSKYTGLEEFGGGGLSGNPLLPFVVDWIKKFRNLNTKTPIKASGGMMSVKAVDKVVDAGAQAIEIGTVKLLRPWRVKNIIKRMEKYK